MFILMGHQGLLSSFYAVMLLRKLMFRTGSSSLEQSSTLSPQQSPLDVSKSISDSDCEEKGEEKVLSDTPNLMRLGQSYNSPSLLPGQMKYFQI
jgi:hypothetical protein